MARTDEGRRERAGVLAGAGSVLVLDLDNGHRICSGFENYSEL